MSYLTNHLSPNTCQVADWPGADSETTNPVATVVKPAETVATTATTTPAPSAPTAASKTNTSGADFIYAEGTCIGARPYPAHRFAGFAECQPW